MLKVLARVLGPHCYVATSQNRVRGLALVQDRDFDLVIVPMALCYPDGNEWISRLQDRDVEVIVVAPQEAINEASDAIQRGAYGYVVTPLEPHALTVLVKRAVERRELRTQLRTARARERALRLEVEGMHLGDLVVETPAMRRVVELARRASRIAATVLITGERGTGKSTIAHAIHRHGYLPSAPCVSLSCGSGSEAVLEAELFGCLPGAVPGVATEHLGAFTEASGGTLVLQHVDELPLMLQAKLDRVLKERSVRRIGEDAERPVNQSS